MAKHVPEPWEADGRRIVVPRRGRIGQKETIAELYEGEDAEANAQHIVRTVNAVPKLLAMCKGIEDLLTTDFNALRPWAKEIDALFAAIAEAEPEA